MTEFKRIHQKLTQIMNVCSAGNKHEWIIQWNEWELPSKISRTQADSLNVRRMTLKEVRMCSQFWPALSERISFSSQTQKSSDVWVMKRDSPDSALNWPLVWNHPAELAQLWLHNYYKLLKGQSTQKQQSCHHLLTLMLQTCMIHLWFSECLFPFQKVWGQQDFSFFFK